MYSPHLAAEGRLGQRNPMLEVLVICTVFRFVDKGDPVRKMAKLGPLLEPRLSSVAADCVTTSSSIKLLLTQESDFHGAYIRSTGAPSCARVYRSVGIRAGQCTAYSYGGRSVDGLPVPRITTQGEV